MTFNLLISRNMYPPEDSKDDWIIARTFDEAAQILIHHIPDSIASDPEFADDIIPFIRFKENE